MTLADCYIWFEFVIYGVSESKMNGLSRKLQLRASLNMDCMSCEPLSAARTNNTSKKARKPSMESQLPPFFVCLSIYLLFHLTLFHKDRAKRRQRKRKLSRDRNQTGWSKDSRGLPVQRMIIFLLPLSSCTILKLYICCLLLLDARVA